MSAENCILKAPVTIETANEIEAFEEMLTLLDLQSKILPEKYGGMELVEYQEEILNRKKRCYSALENLISYQRLETRIESVQG